LPPGKIALTFQVNSVFNPLPTRDQWDRFIKEFTASDPQVGLVDLRVTFGPASDAAANSDCFYYPSNIVPSTTGNTLLNLDPFLNADASFDKADFPGSMLVSVQRDSKTYALPIDIQPVVLRYDPARWSASKLPAPANNWGIEALVDALKALKTTAPDATSGPFVDAGTNGTYLLVLIAAYGGVPIDYRTNPPTVNFTAPATVTAIRQALDLARNGYIRYGALGDLIGGPDSVFPNNTTAIYPSTLDGPAVTTKVRGIDPNKPVLFPAGREFSGLAYNLGTAYISAQAPSPDACYRFISAMSKRPELFQTMPARRSVLSNAAFKAATNPDLLALYNQVDALLKDPRTVAFPAFEKGTITISNLLVPHWLYEAFDKYVLNNGDLDAALKEAEAYAKGFLGCTANLPPLTLANAGPDTRATTNAYLDCAIKVDGRLKPILDPMYVR
jgi:ABC-type glycerol-3-phosphate transport system substrate-binding protein